MPNSGYRCEIWPVLAPAGSDVAFRFQVVEFFFFKRANIQQCCYQVDKGVFFENFEKNVLRQSLKCKWQQQYLKNEKYAKELWTES